MKNEAHSKAKGFIGEFKEFIARGNVMDMAVGVIIGAAFQSIINSLVDDVVMPVLTLITGGIHFENWFVSLDGTHYDTLAQAQAAGASTLNYGNFITAIINFLLMAIVIFTFVKIMNRIAEFGKKPEPQAAPTTKICPFCKTEIAVDAVRCPNCTSELLENKK